MSLGGRQSELISVQPRARRVGAVLRMVVDGPQGAHRFVGSVRTTCSRSSWCVARWDPLLEQIAQLAGELWLGRVGLRRGGSPCQPVAILRHLPLLPRRGSLWIVYVFVRFADHDETRSVGIAQYFAARNSLGG